MSDAEEKAIFNINNTFTDRRVKSSEILGVLAAAIVETAGPVAHF